MLATIPPNKAEELLHDWPLWARATQLPPQGEWLTWAMIAGRGAGKTRAGAEWVRAQVIDGAGRVALVAPTAGDARDVMVEGESGLLAVCWEGDRTSGGAVLGRPVYEPSKRRVTWANGAQAALFSAEEPERLRGPQHDRAWADELAAWGRGQETWDMLMFGLRLGRNPRAMVTTTPKPVPVLRSILKDPRTAVTKGSTFDNAAFLADSFLTAIRDRYEGTRLGRQELFAELLEDIPGALWSDEMIQRCELPELRRVVVGVDPSGAGSDDEGADEIGIVAAGIDADGFGYVLEDATMSGGPTEWGRAVVRAAERHRAERIVAEKNFGGAMVEHVIRTVDPNAPVRMVNASRGKAQRAEPVAALYEQGRVFHCGVFPRLEDQMRAMTASGYQGEGSPDRLDAAVWALTDLMLSKAVEHRFW